MLILGIETSCDETAIAIIEKNKNGIVVLSNAISSQIDLHSKWGGVVPNLAAREHLKNIIPVFESALKEANKKLNEIDLIAVTNGPGLIPALLIGTNFAKTLSYLSKKPLLGVNHIEGHIYANFIDNENPKQKNKIKFPILSLVVSGGHTQLILMSDHFKYEVIGETLDDAAGEAFDKVARILGLSYPGGPIISQLAKEYQLQNNDFPTAKLFPRPMLHNKDFNFSFSGLKTAVLYKVKDFKKENKLKEDEQLPKDFVQKIAYEFQEAATDVLTQKTIKAALKYNPQTIFLAGGVSANNTLRDKLSQAVKKDTPQIKYHPQPITYSTDNATMIAIAAAYHWDKMSISKKKNLLNNWKNLQTNAQLKI